jgi:uncharacterized circularly permuted ATP-grasp superfamily protein
MKPCPDPELAKMGDPMGHSIGSFHVFCSFPVCTGLKYHQTLRPGTPSANPCKARHYPIFMNLDNYQTEGFFDEMFSAEMQVRPHYHNLLERLNELSVEEFHQKRESVDLSFLRQGITFTVYGEKEGTEKIFPFDLIPRIIPNSEWEPVARGLEQRITALNLFLKDIYNEQKILKDGVIPEHFILSAKYYRPEFRHIPVIKDIYIHICGTDLIRDHDGKYLVLEDNARSPSGCVLHAGEPPGVEAGVSELFPTSRGAHHPGLSAPPVECAQTHCTHWRRG